MLTRLIDFFKSEQITAMFLSLTSGESAPEQSEIGVSSLMDTWILLRNLEHSGERNRALYILKSRGMAHSNQVREFQLSNEGIDLVDVYAGPGALYTGTARLAQEAQDQAEAASREEEIARLRRSIDRKRRAVEAQVSMLRSELEAEEQEAARIIEQETRRSKFSAQTAQRMAIKRRGEVRNSEHAPE